MSSANPPPEIPIQTINNQIRSITSHQPIDHPTFFKKHRKSPISNDVTYQIWLITNQKTETEKDWEDLEASAVDGSKEEDGYPGEDAGGLFPAGESREAHE